VGFRIRRQDFQVYQPTWEIPIALLWRGHTQPLKIPVQPAHRMLADLHAGEMPPS
jgi:hypothetical protein